MLGLAVLLETADDDAPVGCTMLLDGGRPPVDPYELALALAIESEVDELVE